MEYDYRIKLIIVGNRNVGKSCLFNRLQGKYETPTTTVGVDFLSYIKYSNEIKTKITIWDTAGQERYLSIIRAYFREVAGIILMFDLTEYTTLHDCKKWLDIIKSEIKCNCNHPILLLGNKNDMKTIIKEKDINTFINKHNNYNIIYKEISTKNDNNLEELIDLLVNKVFDTVNTYECKGIVNTLDNTSNNVTLTEKDKKNRKSCCTIN